MSILLKPIGEYDYNPAGYSIEEAWAQLKDAFNKECFVVCKAVSYLADEDCLEINFNNIRGEINRGYITQYRYLSSDFFLGKTFCVKIMLLNEKTRTFVATRIPVEIEAKRQIRALNIGDNIKGNIVCIGRTGDYAFVEIMEGCTLFLSATNILPRKPRNCQKITSRFSIGDCVEGVVTYIDCNSEYETVGKMSCVRLQELWEKETAHLEVGSVVEGYAIVNPNSLSGNSYYIVVSDHVYVEFDSKTEPPLDQSVKVQIIEKELENYRLIGVWKEPVSLSEMFPVTAAEPEIKKKGTFNFLTPIKATLSPFAVRNSDIVRFEQAPNRWVSIETVLEKVRIGHIKEIHILILNAINDMVFCTSKMIMAYLNSTGSLPIDLSQNKLNLRISTMIKLGIIDVFRFNSDDGEGVFRVYFLARNGEQILKSYRGIKRTSFDSTALVTPVQDVKRYLATNQIILAFWEQFSFFQKFKLREVFNANDDTPVRASGRIIFTNSNLLLETQRRYAGWQEKLLEKANRYLLLMQHYESKTLPQKSVVLQEKSLFLLMVCEDEEHAREIRELLIEHELYHVILFTYDLRLFNVDINEAIFRFSSDGQTIISCNATELLNNLPKSQMNREILYYMTRNPNDVLDYLNKNNTTEVRSFVSNDLKDIYRVNKSGDFEGLFPDSAQYYVNLLYAITHNPLELQSSSASNLYRDFLGSDTKIEKDKKIASSHSSKPSDLEYAVQLVAKQLGKWINLNITKQAICQTAGLQFGYDVGMIFKIYGNSYHIAFECKNYEKLREENVDGKDARLKIDSYASNLLQYYLHCPRSNKERNYWVLVSPHADLQNDIYERLFEQWNRDFKFMNLRALTKSQTPINCREFLSLDNEAYNLVYGEDTPLNPEKKDSLAKQIFDYIVEENIFQKELDVQISNYPFFQENMQLSEPLMTLQTETGESIREMILQKLQDGKSVFLIGEYGSGKTYMTYQIIKSILDERNQFGNDFLPPLWFQLAEFNQYHNNYNLYDDNIQNIAEEFLKNGLEKHKLSFDYFYDRQYQKRLIILDGLDEITSGLSESSFKLKLLKKIIEKMKRDYGSNVVFLITSREIDFKSCISNLSGDEILGNFCKIHISDCMLEDAKHKLQILEEKETQNTKQRYRLTENENLMNIARKPLYFGFLAELIKEWGDGCRIENEIDILREIINRSIKKYLREDNRYSKERIYELLHQYAISISINLTLNKEVDSEVITAFNPESVELKNVLRIQVNEYGNYQVCFYHNAIREYLVADELFLVAKSMLNKQSSDYFKMDRILRQIALTPEMINFFCKLVDQKCSNKHERLGIVDEIKNRLVKSDSLEDGRIGSNLFSILCHLNTGFYGIQGLNLNGICANNLHLHKCKLENIKLQNSKLQNLHLFDVELKKVDFRDADLTGLVMGTNEDIIDVYHRLQNEHLSIFVLYADNQMVEYYFENSNKLVSYEIIPMVNKTHQRYLRLYPIDNDIALYNDQCLAFANFPDRCYVLPESYRLLDLKSNLIQIDNKGIRELVYLDNDSGDWKKKQIIMSVEEDIFFLNSDVSLYIADSKLKLKKSRAILCEIELHADFECFTAFCCEEDSKINVFIKYKDNIQIISYETTTQLKNEDLVSMSEISIYQRMIAINENLVYAVSGNSIHLLELNNYNPITTKLQIKVKCKDLILENGDGTKKVKGYKEFELLKNAQNKKVYNCNDAKK